MVNKLNAYALKRRKQKMRQKGKYQKSVPPRKRNGLWVILLILLLLVGVVLMAIRLLGASRREKTQALQELQEQIDSEAVDWTMPEVEDRGGAQSGIRIPGYSSIPLPADTETVNLVLVNPEGNPCYFTFELVLNDTGESLYQSGLVPPGQAVSEITLSRALTAGEYEATIKVSTTSLADGSAMNGANVETVLIVQ